MIMVYSYGGKRETLWNKRRFHLKHSIFAKKNKKLS